MHRLNKRVAVPSNVVEHGNRGCARRKTTIDSQILHTVHVRISHQSSNTLKLTRLPSFFLPLNATTPPVIVHARLDHEFVNASQRLWGRRQRHYEWLTPVASCLYALIGTVIATIALGSGYVLTDYVIFVAINSAKGVDNPRRDYRRGEPRFDAQPNFNTKSSILFTVFAMIVVEYWTVCEL